MAVTLDQLFEKWASFNGYNPYHYGGFRFYKKDSSNLSENQLKQRFIRQNPQIEKVIGFYGKDPRASVGGAGDLVFNGKNGSIKIYGNGRLRSPKGKMVNYTLSENGKLEYFPSPKSKVASNKIADTKSTKDSTLTNKNVKPKITVSSYGDFGGIEKGWKDSGQFDNLIKHQLSSQQLHWLDSMGIKTKNAETLQQGINKYLTSIGNPNRIAEDGHWGTQSQNALDAILKMNSNNIQNITQDLSATSLNEEPDLPFNRREGYDAGYAPPTSQYYVPPQGNNLFSSWSYKPKSRSELSMRFAKRGGNINFYKKIKNMS